VRFGLAVDLLLLFVFASALILVEGPLGSILSVERRLVDIADRVGGARGWGGGEVPSADDEAALALAASICRLRLRPRSPLGSTSGSVGGGETVAGESRLRGRDRGPKACGGKRADLEPLRTTRGRPDGEGDGELLLLLTLLSGLAERDDDACWRRVWGWAVDGEGGGGVGSGGGGGGGSEGDEAVMGGAEGSGLVGAVEGAGAGAGARGGTGVGGSAWTSDDTEGGGTTMGVRREEEVEVEVRRREGAALAATSRASRDSRLRLARSSMSRSSFRDDPRRFRVFSGRADDAAAVGVDGAMALVEEEEEGVGVAGDWTLRGRVSIHCAAVVRRGLPDADNLAAPPSTPAPTGDGDGGMVSPAAVERGVSMETGA